MGIVEVVSQVTIRQYDPKHCCEQSMDPIFGFPSLLHPQGPLAQVVMDVDNTKKFEKILYHLGSLYQFITTDCSLFSIDYDYFMSLTHRGSSRKCVTNV
jgi:hypothetical protein